MLKIYDKKFFVSIDGAKWRRLSSSGTVMLEESQAIPESILFENLSFEECYNMLQSHLINGMYCTTAGIFKKVPAIDISYSGSFDCAQYKHFKTISYKITHEENTYYTLARIMERFPADTVIQYLKERGIATCPMLKE